MRTQTTNTNTNYHWVCPRCYEHFDDYADARAHSCEQDPTEWHHENSVGGVTHEPDYNGSYYTGRNSQCRICTGQEEPF